MIDISRFRNVVIIGLVSFVSILSILVLSRWVGAKHIPIISPLGSGLRTAWNAAA